MNNEKVLKFKSLTSVVFLPMMIVVGTLFAIQIALSPNSQAVFAQVEDGSQIIQQGYATSTPDPLPDHEAHQSVTILRLRDDNAVYSGRITFTTTKPVEVQILHRDTTRTGTEQIPNIPEAYGAIAILDLPGGNGQVSITNVEPKFTEGAAGSTFAASVPFSGNAVALHNLNGEQFATTYTATADVLGPATRVDNIATEDQEANQEQQPEEGQEVPDQEQQPEEGQEVPDQEQQPEEEQQEQQ